MSRIVGTFHELPESRQVFRLTCSVFNQLFYATVLVSNFESIFEQEAEEELRENNRAQTLKYTEYRINKNILVGKLRNRLIEMVLEEDNETNRVSQKSLPKRRDKGFIRLT